jgi:hypothetical protein
LYRGFNVIVDTSVGAQRSGGEEDLTALPFAAFQLHSFFSLSVNYRAVTRVPAIVPVTSANGVPVQVYVPLLRFAH